MSYDLHNADCQEFLASEPAGKYDLLLIDPPYRTTNLDFDKAPGLDWATWWPQAWRVLKPAGLVVAFAADLFTIDLIQSQREAYRYRLVWEKTRNVGFLSANRRPMRSHEDILVFSQAPSLTTYNPQRVPHSGPSKTMKRPRPGLTGVYGQKRTVQYEDDGTRHPGSVLCFSSGDNAQQLHPTQKPLDLMRWLVRTYSNPGDMVLDCFAGSGSTLHACLLEGRQGMGVELDSAYYATAQQRLRAVVATPQLFAATA